MKKSLIFISAALLFGNTFLLGGAESTIDNYYQSVFGLQGEELKHALHEIIKDHVVYPYFSDSTIATKDIMIESDADPTNPENIILFYSGRSQDKDYRDHGDNFDYLKEYGITQDDSWNREHIWAKSHGFPNMTDTAYTDVHHLRPADRSVNGARGNRDFDWGGYPLEEVNGCFYDYDSWEPPDRVKGDVARMMFYMAVRYEGDNGTYDLELLDETGTYGPRFGKLSTLLRWHKLDPVDNFERHRNDVIYSYQKNRNPFIDHPEFVSLIWGEPSLKPIINFSEPELRFGTQKIYEVSEPIVLVVSGYNLVDEVKVKVSMPFSFSPKPGNYSVSEQILTPKDGFINQEINIFFNPKEKIHYADTLFVFSQEAKKNYILVSGFGIDPNSQILLFTSFEGGSEGWTTFSAAGNEDWYHSSYGDRQFMKMSGYHADEPCVDWLISPTLDLQNYHDIILSFETAKNHSDITSGLEVVLSTDYVEGNDPMNYTWHTLNPALSKGYYEWVHSGYIDISDYADSNAHIAFKYTNSSPNKATSWEVDDVEVIGTKTN